MWNASRGNSYSWIAACLIWLSYVNIEVKVTRPSYFVGVPSYFEALSYPHLHFDRESNIQDG